MIRLSQIDFRYPEGDFRLAFDELAITPERAAAIIGPSGCGKSTLLNLIAGILPAGGRGRIEVGGTDVGTLNDHERRLFRIRNVGFVFQDFALLDYLNLLDNILHPYRINAALRLTPDVKARARDLAGDTGLGGKLNRYVHQVSQGEQQRAAICRALIAAPSVILADEPTGNLDPSNKQAILDLLLDHARRNQATLIVATHDHDLLPSFDQVVDFQELAAL